MIYRFETFELDGARFELRNRGEAVAVEPQVLSLLMLLASNPDRLVSKDEIIEKIWNNRIISDAAIAARIKSARRAIDDDGTQQRLLRTVHGRGVRFVGDVEFIDPHPPAASVASPAAAVQVQTVADGDPDKPSIAVLPFRIVGDAGPDAYIADALADELIADLARLRWLFVIARGSSFRFRGSAVDCQHAGRALSVRYCLTGNIAFARGGVSCSVELVDTANGGVLWADSREEALDRLHEMRHEVASHVLAALEVRIPLHEAERARSQHPGQLSAWAAFHAGLDHMFRFNKADNHRATRMFETALQKDPNFARAAAGLSFTRFQNAFLNYTGDRAAEAEAARTLAERAMQLDRLDPFCHLNMGRSLWLSGDLAESREWLDQATLISPNYAQGIYSKAWTETLIGNADAGERDARLALHLSPLDPLRYAMIATSSLSHILTEEYEEAAILGERAARSPGAHKHIAIIAAIATMLAGHRERSVQWVGAAKKDDPGLLAQDFLRSFPFAPSAAREKIERALSQLGL